VAELIPELLVGFLAGFVAGQFGVGGGLVTTPAIRLVLGYPELVAVGTPLVTIIPTAITGGLAYTRRGLADVRAGLMIGLVGAPTSVLGAWVASLVGGQAILVVTAVLIVYVAGRTARDAWRPTDAPDPDARVDAREALQREDGAASGRSRRYLPALGVGAGFLSGLLGLGGGFVIVPALMRFFGYPVKRAIGTSLVAIAVLAVPGAAAHYALGHVDVPLAAAMTLGVIPGALLGARVTAVAKERTVRLGFAVVLALTGVALGLSELGVFARVG
jgi:uncharacterized membrane protein YfcA